jgi:hypothetical protein
MATDIIITRELTKQSTRYATDIKYKTSSPSRSIGKLNLDTAQSTQQKNVFTQLQPPINNLDQRTGNILGSPTRTGQKSGSVTFTGLIQNIGTTTKTPSGGVGLPGRPFKPIKPRNVLPSFTKPSMLMKGSKRGLKAFKRSGYQPSYSAFAFGIKGKYKEGKLARSGVNFRPITSSWKISERTKLKGGIINALKV